MNRTRSPHRKFGTRRTLALGVSAAMATALLAACGSGSSSGKPTLVWYINPDPVSPTLSGQALLAQQCSTDKYTIEVQDLPTAADDQRVQLARRLAAHDSSIDLMSMDPAFTAEFAAANFLAPIPPADAQELTKGSLPGILSTATVDGKIIATPLWANTQVLWYRKSFAQKAGLDMTQPVTWDQIIKAASDNDGTVGVQGNLYEGYSVWINALIMGAGGQIVEDPGAGVDAKITINSPAGVAAANVIHELAHSSAAEPDLSVSNEGTVLAPFATAQGAFQVNWTFVYPNYKTDPTTFKDLGWTRYPETIAGHASRPPVGGINIGIGAYSKHVDDDIAATKCITSQKSQIQYADQTGNMPANAAAYSSPELQKAYPADLLQLFRTSLAAGGPRPNSAYWSDISSAIQNTWHPPESVSSSTPASSSTYIEQVLQGKALL